MKSCCISQTTIVITTITIISCCCIISAIYLTKDNKYNNLNSINASIDTNSINCWTFNLIINCILCESYVNYTCISSLTNQTEYYEIYKTIKTNLFDYTYIDIKVTNNCDIVNETYVFNKNIIALIKY